MAAKLYAEIESAAELLPPLNHEHDCQRDETGLRRGVLQTLRSGEKHKIPDDDAVHLLRRDVSDSSKALDAIRQRADAFYLEQFRSNVNAATEAAQAARETNIATLVEILEKNLSATPIETIPKQQAVNAVIAAVLGTAHRHFSFGKLLL